MLHVDLWHLGGSGCTPYGEYVDGPIRATGHFYEGGSSTAAHPDPTSGYGPGVSEDHLDGFPGSHTSMGFGTDITQYNGDVDPDDAAELAVQLSTLGEFRAGLSKKRPPDYTWVAYVVFLHLWFVFWNNYMR
ncbi:hypothetical protein PCANC_15993 [Puccinia coronata f. sp. avenae]|uniref:Uncharacterized protein n=1 Tax=Puccinia coronata f. sp. avenae TaxID=200324 RepID=A0A2N5RWK2_9BASI|nr:hypothetical protein PCASD_26365 [Puccinia coronata f. sp. avenae]PLW52011.1 hypothetical protein PCASD_02154 [Puccinia coronata f. sp. avenae]PLW52716.1 hypothetical protein PCANC_15993 [Puccinia coronata f. sp. avenae]